MKFRILGIILLLALVTAVSADLTCSFINITTGPTGAAGAAGTNGTSCTTGVNFTFTLATGNPATATNVGTATNALLDFGIPVGATGAKGDTGATGAIPDVTQFLFINGTRAMTGNLSMGGFYINSLNSGGFGSDAVNKSYVDAQDSLSSNYNASYVEKSNASYVLVDGSRTMTGNLNLGTKQITSLTTGTTGDTATNKTYVDAVNTSMKGYVDSTAGNYNASYVEKSNTSYVLTSNGSYVLTNNASYVLTNNGSYVLTNNQSYVLASNGTYVQTGNTSYVLTNNGSYVLTNNATYVKNPVFGYVTLMAGSAMVTTTTPTVMNQWETATNKNNYISLNFTDGGSAGAQWIADMPGDWNSSDATNGKLIFTPIWTAAEGSGTVNWTIAGKLFPDDAALDTALVNISSSVDTLITAGDVHVGPDTTAAVVTSVGTGGQTVIFRVVRDSETDTLSGTAQLLGLRIKYIRTLA